MILGHVLCLNVFVSMSSPKSIYVYLYNLFSIFRLIFIVINHLMSLKQAHLFFVHILQYLLLFLNDNVDEESESVLNRERSASGCC